MASMDSTNPIRRYEPIHKEHHHGNHPDPSPRHGPDHGRFHRHWRALRGAAGAARLQPDPGGPQPGEAERAGRAHHGRDAPRSGSAGGGPERPRLAGHGGRQAAPGRQHHAAGEQRRRRHAHAAAGERCGQHDADGRAERDRPDAPHLRRRAGLRGTRAGVDHQYRVDRGGGAGDPQRGLWGEQGVRAGAQPVAPSRAEGPGRARAGGAAGRHGDRFLGDWRPAGRAPRPRHRDAGGGHGGCGAGRLRPGRAGHDPVAARHRDVAGL
ncbi:hypothetical protein D3C72_1409390 [compost metagenome]